MWRSIWRIVACTAAIIGAGFGTLAGAHAQPADRAVTDAGRVWRHYPRTVEAPPGSPNILLILTDDVGFGASSPFGGPIPTPSFAALASSGLRYTEFHTTAMCSPTRAALLTGRNHHAVASGVIAEMSTDEEGYTSVIPDTAASVGEILHENGYATAWFGKNHNTPKWENTPIGPYDHWPNAMGFDYFYGFNGSQTNQFAPALIENRNIIDPPRIEDYILEQDLVDHAIHWLDLRHTLTPQKPFLLYYASGSTHMPNQAPAAWIAKFRGQFDMGWDQMREQTFARQKMLGVIPADTKLTPRPSQIPAWDSLTADQKRIAARLMEVYAAQLAYSDDQIGRILEELKRTGDIDNTVVIFIQGDNGAAGEILAGTRNYTGTFAGVQESDHESLAHLDEFGGPKSLGLYPVGWAWAMDTPFQWSKQVASHFGGTRNGMVIAWPHHIKDPGAFRTQFHHVIDIAPTIYEMAHITPPAVVKGVRQQSFDGASLLYTLDNSQAASRHREQYFEMLGNAAFYKDGWIASTTPIRAPWEASAPPGVTTHPWELYDLAHDYSQADNIASKYPNKLKELQADFLAAAKANKVLPLDDSFIARFNPLRRPALLRGRKDFTFYPSATRYPDAAFPQLGPDWKITVDLDVPEHGADGPLIVGGDRFTGWGLLVVGSKPVFISRTSDRVADMVSVEGPSALPPGHHELSVEFQKHKAILRLDEQALAEREMSKPLGRVADVYVGRTGLVPLVDAMQLPPVYGGKIDHVDIRLGGGTP